MKVGVFCTNNYTYPLPDGVIYANQVLAGKLAEELGSLGVEVVFFAPEGSLAKVPVCSFNMPPYNLVSDHGKMQEGGSSYRYEDSFLAKIYNYAREEHIDILHAHLRPFSVLPFATTSEIPTVLTVHDPLSYPAYEALTFFKDFEQIYWVALSHSHSRSRSDLSWSGVIYNGIDPDLWQISNQERSYLCFAGRIMPIKGVSQAVRLALNLGIPLKIAGSLYDSDREFFSQEIEPFLGENISYLGPLKREELVDLYQGALALLMPIQWEEPFGLVMIEAMSCGTPVVALNRGAVSEIVVDGKTGFVCSSEKEMAKAISKLDQIDFADCRKRAVDYFSLRKMAEEYHNLYIKILNS